MVGLADVWRSQRCNAYRSDLRGLSRPNDIHIEEAHGRKRAWRSRRRGQRPSRSGAMEGAADVGCLPDWYLLAAGEQMFNVQPGVLPSGSSPWQGAWRLAFELGQQLPRS